MVERYTKSEKVKRWFLYCIAPTFFPIIMAILYDFIIYNFNFIKALSRHSLDFVLVNFAIAVSIFESTMNVETKVDKKVREIFIYKSVVIGLICFCFYAGYYLAPDNISLLAKVVFYIVFLILILCNIKLGRNFQNYTGLPDEIDKEE